MAPPPSSSGEAAAKQPLLPDSMVNTAPASADAAKASKQSNWKMVASFALPIIACAALFAGLSGWSPLGTSPTSSFVPGRKPSAASAPAVKSPSLFNIPTECSGRGMILANSNQCLCDIGYAGIDCSTWIGLDAEVDVALKPTDTGSDARKVAMFIDAYTADGIKIEDNLKLAAQVLSTTPDNVQLFVYTSMPRNVDDLRKQYPGRVTIKPFALKPTNALQVQARSRKVASTLLAEAGWTWSTLTPTRVPDTITWQASSSERGARGHASLSVSRSVESKTRCWNRRAWVPTRWAAPARSVMCRLPWTTSARPCSSWPTMSCSRRIKCVTPSSSRNGSPGRCIGRQGGQHSLDSTALVVDAQGQQARVCQQPCGHAQHAIRVCVCRIAQCTDGLMEFVRALDQFHSVIGKDRQFRVTFFDLANMDENNKIDGLKPADWLKRRQSSWPNFAVEAKIGTIHQAVQHLIEPSKGRVAVVGAKVSNEELNELVIAHVPLLVPRELEIAALDDLVLGDELEEADQGIIRFSPNNAEDHSMALINALRNGVKSPTALAQGLTKRGTEL
ncbi:hypothetical protein BCR44DRAFT_1223389 [Catenaria anguillulae PL171]|uniref:EGF-like domain-containing protein n=1 Tax=Catenaria anguillulae PL171 TaxID=765915 RepID=A0A1Y2HG73_9FUNG|nr:hypothetical protein BCR44DRAFT_1223389 [Catenaria anguillulae PL171]